jgi:hypothetical protein
MEALAMVIIFIAVALSAIGGLWFVFISFAEGGILWGLAVIFIPFVPLIFLILYWRYTWKPFALLAVGFALSLGAAQMIP